MTESRIRTEQFPFRMGRWQTLPIVSLESFGAYLGDAQTHVLLPKKQVPQGAVPGDEIEVFLYRDSSDRPIATVHTPKLTAGEIAPLLVKQVTSVGAFLDCGLEKDLLLPYREQTEKVQEGFYYPVAMYVDKSDRLAATMWIDSYIKASDPDEKKKKKALYVLQADAENVYVRIRRMGGKLPYNDKADPSRIEADFKLSKNALKKAVGVLYKARRLVILPDSIELTE